MPASVARRTRDRFDTVILGVGTAAAMAALSLAQAGLRVVSVSAASLPDRPPLELASPAAVRLLAAAGLPRVAAIRPCHEIRFRWGSPEVHRRNHLLEPYGPAAFVNQARLRAWLQRAAAGADAQAWRAAVSCAAPPR